MHHANLIIYDASPLFFKRASLRSAQPSAFPHLTTAFSYIRQCRTARSLGAPPQISSNGSISTSLRLSRRPTRQLLHRSTAPPTRYRNARNPFLLPRASAFLHRWHDVTIFSSPACVCPGCTPTEKEGSGDGRNSSRYVCMYVRPQPPPPQPYLYACVRACALPDAMAVNLT
ncbi:hypothetical protein BKA81DRAFT_97544 [Phyllosticta paracitricarpa]